MLFASDKIAAKSYLTSSPLSPGVLLHACKQIYVLLYCEVFAEKIVCFRAIDNFEKIFIIGISKNNIGKSHHAVAISTNTERIAKFNFCCFYSINFKASFFFGEKIVIHNGYIISLNLNISFIHVNCCNDYESDDKNSGNKDYECR